MLINVTPLTMAVTPVPANMSIIFDSYSKIGKIKYKSSHHKRVRSLFTSYPFQTLINTKRETGVGPATFSLARRRSTTEPLAQKRMVGIEPAQSAWKAEVLPLNYIRKIVLPCPEPESNQRHEDFQSSALPTELSGHLEVG